MTQPSTTVAYGSVVLAAVLWGGSIVAQKMALGSFSAVEASVLRDIGGLAILLTTWWLQERDSFRITWLDAQLLGIEEINGFYMASVEFSGMIREEPSAGPSPFREVWNMTRPKAGQVGWLVAGVQALQ